MTSTPPLVPYRALRRVIGLGVAVGFFVAFAGYMLTGAGWWFLCPLAGFFGAWRLALGRWPSFGKTPGG